jgi:arylsulfatase A-like enzyme
MLGANMNTILILIDSLNRHCLPFYEPTPVETPNLDAFEKKAWRFDNHFVGSLPCMPARREIFAGFREMMWRPWGPLEPFDARLPTLLEMAGGCTTGIVTDHYHYWEEPGNGYLQSFRSVETIRGHEIDNWKPPVPDDDPVPGWVQSMEAWLPKVATRRYYANVKDFQTEEDFFTAKVLSGGAQWLQDHAQQKPFFLQVEPFGAHEPFYIPEPYASMYGDASLRDRYTVWPPYADPDFLANFLASTPDEGLDFIRSQYFGKVTMIDHWFGEFLKTVDELSLWDDTVIIVTTDHGHDLGEHNKLAKQYPHYDSHAHIPLLVWHPDNPGNGMGVSALTSTVDLFATILDVMGVPMPEGTHSKTFLPILKGETSDHREALLYGTFGQGVCCTDGEWTIFKSPVPGEPLFSYSSMLFRTLEPFYFEWLKLLDQSISSVAQPVDQGYFIPGADLPQWKMPIEMRPLSQENFLFNRREDPEQNANLWENDPGQRKRMLDVLRALVEEEGAPPEQYTRLGLGGDT